jgi:hypothetical protein
LTGKTTAAFRTSIRLGEGVEAFGYLRIVRDHYEPVYRHRDVEFGDFSDRDGKYEQTLTIVDDDNNVWTAIYMLDREPDGTWRTSGCVLVKSVESSL